MKSCLSFDNFGSSVSHLVNGKKSLATPIGACISILIFSIFGLFTLIKMQILMKRDDTKFMTKNNENAIELDE